MLFVGAEVLGLGQADVAVENGRIAAVGKDLAVETERRMDFTGQCLSPGFIDSHVHLAYSPRSAEMMEGGVVAVVDLGSPLAFLEQRLYSLEVRYAGPMITAPQGYPTQSWGAGGYGLEVTGDPAAAVDQVIEAGASVVKIPFQGAAQLTDAWRRVKNSPIMPSMSRTAATQTA